MRHGTTTKPWGREEHDVDLICLLQINPQLYRDPMAVYEMAERRLKELGDYKGKVERFKLPSHQLRKRISPRHHSRLPRPEPRRHLHSRPRQEDSRVEVE